MKMRHGIELFLVLGGIDLLVAGFIAYAAIAIYLDLGIMCPVAFIASAVLLASAVLFMRAPFSVRAIERTAVSIARLAFGATYAAVAVRIVLSMRKDGFDAQSALIAGLAIVNMVVILTLSYIRRQACLPVRVARIE